MRSDYMARINRVLDHIEAHLAEPLVLEDLARVARFSPFHFHRVFAALVGETPAQLIRRLRLEKAAARLVGNRADSVLAIALDCGFQSAAAFARAFKEQFGVSASVWRSGGAEDHLQRKAGAKHRKLGQANRKQRKATQRSSSYLDPVSRTLRWRLEMERQTSTLKADVRVEELPPMHVAYLRHVGPYQGDGALFERLWSEVMKWAGPRGLYRPGETQMLTVYHDDPAVTEEDKLRLSCCLTVPEGTPVDGAFGSMTLPGGAYAIARFTLDASQYGDAWTAVYGGWLPDSGYQPDDRVAFERFPPDAEMKGCDDLHTVEICVPVRPL